jgi:(p)ppGpp synthase/HD superfamily hydrolase
MPENSTALDFAFAVHSDIGKKCKMAKVNGKPVPLNYKLENADVVEIITSSFPQIKRGWINFVNSAKATAKIRTEFGILPKHMLVVPKGPVVQEEKVNFKIAKCCSPLPGDDVIGVKTTKRKIAVHRRGCSNLEKIPKGKLFAVDWGRAKREYETGIRVLAMDSPSLLTQLLNLLAENKAVIRSSNAKMMRTGRTECSFNIKINDAQHLEKIMKSLEKVPGVEKVSRVGG